MTRLITFDNNFQITKTNLIIITRLPRLVFPQTIRDWKRIDLPDSLISSAEMSDDCMSKFASLVRARD